MIAKIKRTIARQVLDSRGNPTIWTAVITDKDEKYYSVVPSGASTGSKEALELRDHNKEFFNGKSVLNAILNTNNVISEKIKDQKVTNQEEIDQIMIDLDGTKTKSFLGANAMLGVSMAVARAGAKEENVELFQYIRKKYDPHDDSWNYSTKYFENSSDLKPAKNYFLPNPMFNMINGGSHAFNSTDFQEFMVVPITGNFQKSLQPRRLREASLGKTKPSSRPARSTPPPAMNHSCSFDSSSFRRSRSSSWKRFFNCAVSAESRVFSRLIANGEAAACFVSANWRRSSWLS